MDSFEHHTQLSPHITASRNHRPRHQRLLLLLLLQLQLVPQLLSDCCPSQLVH
jgi:hypothetical protein